MKNYKTFYANVIEGCVLCSPDDLPEGGNWIVSDDVEFVICWLYDATETSDQLVAKTGEGNSCTVRAEMSIALIRLTGIEPDGPEFLLPTRKELPGRGLREKILHHLWGTEGLVKRLREATPDRRGHALSCFASPWDPGAKDDDPTRRWQATLVDEHLQWLRGQYELEGREAGPRNRKADDPRDQAIREFYRDAAQ